MSTPIRWVLAAIFAGVCVAPSFAQGNATPTVEIIGWRVSRGAVTTTVYDRDLAVGTRASIPAFRHEENDLVTVTLELFDADWAADNADQNAQDFEGVFLRFRAFGLQIQVVPPAPPVPAASDSFFPRGGDGFRPSTPDPFPFNFSFVVPRLNGPSQERLRGLRDWDVSYLAEFQISNDEEPQTDENGLLDVGEDTALFFVITSPDFAPPNPPPVADAGADQTVAVNAPVTLDASLTFDNFNTGFQPGDQNVFLKDVLTFSWEVVSTPAGVDPDSIDIAQTDTSLPTAKVTLTTVGTYIFRVTVRDNASGAPSTSTTSIEVVQQLPQNIRPRARIDGPSAPVALGSVVTLSAARSSDPEGKPLSYRWLQTNEVFGPLPVSALSRVFQPLNGVESEQSVWQTVSTGTFYFRLIVSDGQLVSTETFTVQVVEPEVLGLTARTVTPTNNQPPAEPTLSDVAPVIGAPLCGAGLMPLAALPFALLLLRRR